MGIPTLIADNSSDTTDLASYEITSGIDSTYDEYMFVFTDIGPATDGTDFLFQCNVAGESGFNETMTTTTFQSYHNEADNSAAMTYFGTLDQAQGTAYQNIADNLGNGADESFSGILHLFSPSSTTYVKHFYARTSAYNLNDVLEDQFTAGYFNVTGAIDEIEFKMASGNFDGSIQMFGIK